MNNKLYFIIEIVFIFGIEIYLSDVIIIVIIFVIVVLNIYVNVE